MQHVQSEEGTETKNEEIILCILFTDKCLHESE